jgi:flavin-dependent dehydrogenase
MIEKELGEMTQAQPRTTTRECDVIILGGGLAGLGLALQLKNATPALDIVVVEKNKFPRPAAIAKVGESTVEIGSHYLAHHLGLADHLQQSHLKKFGIRMFFGAPATDFSLQDELGASQTFGIPTYQIDRGVLENELAARVASAGVHIIQSAVIAAIELGTKTQQVTLGETSRPEMASGISVNTPDSVTGTTQLRGRWIFDAAGRAALLKQNLQLAKKNAHKANAIWFRIDRKILIDQWSDSDAWRERCQPENRRWLSTNHLTGAGYWVWIIPLASGVTSIGIVMDDQAFHSSNIRCADTAMQWLHRNQRQCAEAIDGARFLDFVVLPDYSYDCQQILSDQGWGITGEAGCFADPFYSPGSDFIAFSNGFITDLVATEMRGEDIRFKTLLYEKLFKSIYDNTLSLYTGQYGGFGDRRMMGLKLLWDYSYYWGVLSLLFFRNALTNTNVIRQLSNRLQQAQQLNQQIQAPHAAWFYPSLVCLWINTKFLAFSISTAFYNATLKKIV